MFFSFPPDARWNPKRDAVEFGVGIGEYQGVVRVSRQVFRRFLDGATTPEGCLAAYHLQRTRLERVAERKLRRRQLTEDGNVEITGRDLRAPQPRMRSRGISAALSEAEPWQRKTSPRWLDRRRV